MITLLVIALCFAFLALFMALMKKQRHIPLPLTWILFAILSAYCMFYAAYIGYWLRPHIASPWPIVALVVWLLAAVIVVEAREIRPRRTIITMLIMTIILISIGAFAPQVKTNSLKVYPVTSITTSAQTWKMVDGDYGNNRWFSDGIAEINAAKTDAEASAAASVWLGRVKTDPNLLVGAVKYFLNEDIDKATLTDKDGWATDKAVQLTSRLQLLLGQSKIATANAPNNGYNSGVENNSVVGAAVAGLSGNTKAIQITLPDGRKIWIMARCGNIVTPGSVFPPGKTDELTPKDPTKDVGANPSVAAYKKDATGGDASKGHQTSNEDGATVSNGVQTDPAADAAAAKAAADKAAAEKADAEAAAKKAAETSGGGTVDKNQDHDQATPPGDDW